MFKIITGVTPYNMLASPNYPNCSVYPEYCPGPYCCALGERPLNPSPFGPPTLTKDCEQGCLFDLVADETESVDLCATRPALCSEMVQSLAVQNTTYYEPFRGCFWIPQLCRTFAMQWNYTFGPFLDVPNCPSCNNATIPRTSNTCQCFPLPLCTRQSTCAWNFATGRCDLAPGKTHADWLIARRFDANSYDSYADFID